MVKKYIKGLRGEIVALDDIKRFWQASDENNSGNWEVWAATGAHSTSVFEGTFEEVVEFMAVLDELFEPYDLSNPTHRQQLKLDRPR